MARDDVFQRLARDGAMISRLTSDSRRCGPGAAFFAWRGERADGRAHIGDAVARGAAAVLWDPRGFAWQGQWQVPNAPVERLRERAGDLAAAFHGDPSAAMWVCGVTGTNGKTSCSQWIAAALDASGTRTGVVGTLGTGLYGTPLDEAANTTPDPLEIQQALARFRDAGVAAVSMEVSSHGLEQSRVNGVRFRCALFTNLSHDHLDYHGTMQAYGEAKARLFAMPGLEAAVLNLDDPLGVVLARRLTGTGVRTIGYALSPAGVAPGSVDDTLVALDLAYAGAAMRLAIGGTRGRAVVELAQVGRFNASNALGVLGSLLAHGMDFEAAVARLRALPPVPGRMQRLGGGAQPLVVVDYAHTPDALEKVLLALRPVADASGGALAVVFGAGGERDPAKRPLMGAVASRLADRIVLTSDNPRGEDPLAILAAIRAGVTTGHEMEPDRARAIAGAIAAARAGDVILVAGKGHEAYQEAGGTRTAFSDIEAARAALARRVPS